MGRVGADGSDTVVLILDAIIIIIIFMNGFEDGDGKEGEEEEGEEESGRGGDGGDDGFARWVLGGKGYSGGIGEGRVGFVEVEGLHRWRNCPNIC